MVTAKQIQKTGSGTAKWSTLVYCSLIWPSDGNQNKNRIALFFNFGNPAANKVKN